MKKVLLIVCLFASLFSLAQKDKPWKRIGIDSAAFIENYGSVFEYNYERDQMQKSSHHCLAIFIGAKAFWLNNLSAYLQTHNWTLEDNKEGSNFMKYIFMPVAYAGKATPLIITGWLNKKDRISKVTITGKADDIIDLFIRYWEFSKISLNDLKKKNTIYQEYGADKIIFSWTGINPQIIIVKGVNPLLIPQT